MEHTTHIPQVKRLERTSNRIVSGVCGGLGRYFDLNPAVFRLGLVVLTLLGGAGILVYLAAVLVIPEEGREQSIAEKALAERSDRPWPLVGLGLTAAAIAVLLSRADLWPAAGAGWVLVLVAGLIILWASRHERRHRVLIAVTAVIGLFLAAVATALVVAFAWFDVSLDDGVGDRAYAPARIEQVQPKYKIGVGTLRVDLSRLSGVTGATHVNASVGVGNLDIVVPRNTAVAINAHAKVGEVRALDRKDDGRDANLHIDRGRSLIIDAKVGAGRIDVVRAG